MTPDREYPESTRFGRAIVTRCIMCGGEGTAGKATNGISAPDCHHCEGLGYRCNCDQLKAEISKPTHHPAGKPERIILYRFRQMFGLPLNIEGDPVKSFVPQIPPVSISTARIVSQTDRHYTHSIAGNRHVI